MSGLIENDSDRAWAALSAEDKRAAMRGEPRPSLIQDGPIVRNVSPAAERLFNEVRVAGKPVPLEHLRSLPPGGFREAAVSELVRRGIARVAPITAFVAGGWHDVDALGIVEGFERAMLLHPLSGGGPAGGRR